MLAVSFLMAVKKCDVLDHSPETVSSQFVHILFQSLHLRYVFLVIGTNE